MTDSQARPGPAPVALRSDGADRIRLARTCTLLTPLFGGGVTSGTPEVPHKKEADAVTPVRGTALRGQLRFWWRAIFGCLRESVAEMRRWEDALWGNASMPGRVDVGVRWLEEPKRENVVVFTKKGRSFVAEFGFDGVAYGAFPLVPAHAAVDQTPGTLTRYAGVFEIALSADLRRRAHCPWNERIDEMKNELVLTLDTFCHFGGVGGRTRRGFGSIGCERGAGRLEDIESRWKQVRQGRSPLPSIPHVHGATLVVTSSAAGSTEKVWNEALVRLRDFRQGQEIGRNKGDKMPGRSRWPEPDVIRALTRQASESHGLPIHRLPDAPSQRLKPPVRAFPRAAFGLPIIFHFKDWKQGDPSDQTLQPAEKTDRFPSPLILRPSVDGRRVALRLVATLPERLLLKGSKDEVRHRMSTDEARIIGAVHRKVRSPDVLADFLTFFED